MTESATPPPAETLEASKRMRELVDDVIDRTQCRVQEDEREGSTIASRRNARKMQEAAESKLLSEIANIEILLAASRTPTRTPE